MGKGFPFLLGLAAGVAGLAFAEDTNNKPAPVATSPSPPGSLPLNAMGAFSELGAPANPTPLGRELDGMFFSVEYLNWRIKNGPLPNPMVTSGFPSQAAPGAVGQPGTQVLLGGQGGDSIDYGPFSGLRLNGGFFLDEERRYSWEASGFLLEQRSAFFSLDSGPGTPVVTAPFINPQGNPSSFFAVAPNLQGPTSIHVYSTSRLSGGEANARARFGTPGDGFSWNVLAGGRFAELEENLDYSLATSGSLNGINSQWLGTDQFQCRNWFYGVQTGGGIQYDWNRFHAGAQGKIAIGQTQQNLAVAGSRLVSQNGGAFLDSNGAIYSQPSNSGMYNQSAFAIIPEVQARLGYDITRRIQVFAGYDFFYWSSVLRPGNQVDSVLNPSQFNGGALAGAARPEPQLTQSSIWAQGLSFGLEIKY
ncbi:MAG: hypothetical protein EXR99_13350 [Gemmataceae bacterium]|nr:hypothetical protein [Gemmataceae bacterium]